MGKHRAWPVACVVCLALTVGAYANHFLNEFHFDDSHTVVDNPQIREIGNPLRFFTDARTYSALPIQQQYRPVVTASLALDYWLGGGIDSTFWFHVTTFFWYLVQLALMVLLYRAILSKSGVLPEPARWWALAAAALYAVHPVAAETINYITQRGDLYSTLAVVASLLLYIQRQHWRSTGLYLLPMILGALAKPPALMLPAILAVYVYLFESREDRPAISNAFRALRAALPAVAVSAAMGAFIKWMTPPTYTLGNVDAVRYWITQPWVCVRYIRAFFLPIYLSADTDLKMLTSLWSKAALLGIIVVIGLLLAAWATAQDRDTKPIAFGLLWFLLALLPTSLPPLSEPENDHRMFFPFVGLTLAVVTAAALAMRRWNKTALAAVAFAVLIPCAYGTHLRNEVWETEDSLWLDVTRKSPRNGRGLMNYGVACMKHNDPATAIDYFLRARKYAPGYSLVYLNLGIAYATLGEDDRAEPAFRAALQLDPGNPAVHTRYAQWLYQHKRLEESEREAKQAVGIAPILVEPRHMLIRIAIDRSDWLRARALLQQTMAIDPSDITTHELAAKIPPA